MATLAALAGCAGTPPDAAPAQPPALVFHSALDGYQPLKDEKPVPWEQANKVAYQRGGWRVYAKEAEGDTTVKGALPPSTPSAAPAGHSMPMPMPMPMPKKESP